MTKFLASVATPDEAAIALSAGADIIDLKDPATGALGAVSDEIIRDTRNRIDGKRPLSATIGDGPIAPETLVAKTKERAALGIDFVKIGFPKNNARQECFEALAPLAKKGTKLIAVFFANETFGPELIELAAKNYFTGVMFDTSDKDAGSLMKHRSTPELRGFISEARHLGLMAGLAGSLTAEDVEPLLQLNPDILGFRGALCVNSDRTSTLNLGACQAIRQRIPREEERVQTAAASLSVMTNG